MYKYKALLYQRLYSSTKLVNRFKLNHVLFQRYLYQVKRLTNLKFKPFNITQRKYANSNETVKLILNSPKNLFDLLLTLQWNYNTYITPVLSTWTTYTRHMIKIEKCEYIYESRLLRKTLPWHPIWWACHENHLKLLWCWKIIIYHYHSNFPLSYSV